MLGKLHPKAAFLVSSMECFRLPLCKERWCSYCYSHHLAFFVWMGFTIVTNSNWWQTNSFGIKKWVIWLTAKCFRAVLSKHVLSPGWHLCSSWFKTCIWSAGSSGSLHLTSSDLLVKHPNQHFRDYAKMSHRCCDVHTLPCCCNGALHTLCTVLLVSLSLDKQVVLPCLLAHVALA